MRFQAIRLYGAHMKVKKTEFVKTIALLIVLLILIFIPNFFYQNEKISSELETRTINTETETRTDFVNSSGIVTFAEDKGYASVIKIYNDGQIVLEKYLDENGKAIVLPAGYSIIHYGYENGLKTTIDYFDKDNNPVKILYGYDSIHRTYYSSGDPDTDTYFVNNIQVKRSSGYWQYKRIYKDGRLSEIRYLNQEGALSPETSFGYAVLKRYYIKAGREDYYFDTNEKPVSVSLGQYGVRVEGGTTTYLDADGRPMNTNRGYAILKKEGNKTLYYDQDGDPVAIGHNQYGTEVVEGQKVYLDENGYPIARLDNLLYMHQTLVVLSALFLTAITIVLKRRYKALFIVVYILFIIYMTMWNRKTGDSKSAFVFFWSFGQMFSDPSLGKDVINNIWLFIPLGAALYAPEHRHRWLICIMISICIEIVQYYTGLGLAEFDDVISNGLGAVIGYNIAENAFYWQGRLNARYNTAYS